MENKTFVVPNISCGHCVMTIRREVGALMGVKEVVGDVESKVVTVKWDFPASWSLIEGTLREIGYPPEA